MVYSHTMRGVGVFPQVLKPGRRDLVPFSHRSNNEVQLFQFIDNTWLTGDIAVNHNSVKWDEGHTKLGKSLFSCLCLFVERHCHIEMRWAISQTANTKLETLFYSFFLTGQQIKTLLVEVKDEHLLFCTLY